MLKSWVVRPPIRLLAADIDGTLLNPQFQISEVDLAALRRAHDEGVEVAWQQPLWWGFGTYLNFTLADGRTADRQDVYGASKFTGNAEVYWENQVFSARVAYNYRSKYLQGLVTGVPEYDDAVGDLALSLNYKLGDTVTFTFDGLNLNNPTLKSYGFSRDMPIGRYVNGRQYYFGVRLTF